MSQAAQVNPSTLAEFNQALTALQLRPVDKTGLDEILKTETRERLVKALNQAGTDQRALAYLNRFFGGNGALPRNQPPAAPEPAAYASTNETGPAPEPEPAAGSGEQRGARLNKHVYGSKGALCFEPDETRGGTHTICLDAADATGPKQYNWGGKLRLQLTRDELLQFTAVLFGFLPKCEGKNHGEDNSKGFSLEDQGDKLFMRVFAKGHNIKAVPIFPEDAFYVAQLFLGQMKKNAPWLSASEILATLQRVHAARRGAQGAPRGQQTH